MFGCLESTAVQHRSDLVGWIAAVIVLTVLAGCGDSGDNGDDIAAEKPPWCLSSIGLPDNAHAIGAVLAGMPDEHNGVRRELVASAERIAVFYDEPLEGTPSIQVFSIDTLKRVFPEANELTMFEIMEIILEAGAEPVDPGGVAGEPDEISMDPQADLLWATGDTVEVGDTSTDDVRAPSVMFADPDGSWIFNIVASTPELRVDLVQAFCDATGP